MTKHYLSLSMNFKNEELYLKEWLDYHLIVGVEHFYLYDNSSTDKSVEILKPYIDNGIVTLNSSDKAPIKPYAYEFTLANYSNDSRWIGFIDCDEFINPHIKNDIKEVLQEFEEYPAFAINWKLFGDSGFKTKPDGLVTKNFIKRIDEQEDKIGPSHIKSIVDPKKTNAQFINPHFFIYDQQKSFPKPPKAITENFNFVENGAFSSKISYDKISVHHYWCKSEEEFYNMKCSKPTDDTNSDRKVDLENLKNLYKHYNILANKIVDTSIHRHIEKLSH